MKINALQYISSGTTFKEQEKNIVNALDHGLKSVQLRWKNAEEQPLAKLAIKIKDLCRQYDAQLIINDHVNLAYAIDADGVHLGLTDCSIEEARNVLGSYKIIGGTANTIADVRQRISEGCDYIGLGPFRYTTTKDKLSPLLGINGVENIVRQLREDQITAVPLIVVGGILEGDIRALKEAGVYGIAVSGLINEQPYLAAEIINNLK